MVRTISTLSLLLVCGIAAATPPPPEQPDERPTLDSYGNERPGGNAFSPVFTMQQQPARKRAAPEQRECDEPAAPAWTEGTGGIEEL